MTVELETYSVCAYWMVRKESPEECAERALKLLDGLSRIDPLFTGFLRWGRSGRKDVRVPLKLEKDEIAALFARGVNRRDIDRSIIEDLGFSLAIDSRAKGRSGAHIQMSCGCYTDAVANACVIDCWDEGNDTERLLQMHVLKKTINCMIDAWEPDWVIAGSYQHRVKANEGKTSNDWPVSWLTYVSSQQGKVPPLPAPVQIEPVGDKGMLIILTPERVTVANPEHVELGRRIRELLGRSGALQKRRCEDT